MEEGKMKLRGLIGLVPFLIVLLGFVPYLAAVDFGGELKYSAPTKFQLDGNNSRYKCIAAGDVDGDGDIDLVVIRNNSGVHEVRVYRNKGHSLPIQQMFARGVHQSGQGDADADSVQIYSELPSYLYGNPVQVPSFYESRSTHKWTLGAVDLDCSLALTYTTYNGRTVVDSIYVGRSCPTMTPGGSFDMTEASDGGRAGKILRLLNPLVYASGSGLSPWIRAERDTDGTVKQYAGDASGYANNREPWILGAAIKMGWDAYKTSFTVLAAADYDKSGTATLFAAPWGVAPLSTTSQRQGVIAKIARVTSALLRGNVPSFIWTDTAPTTNQFYKLQAVDMNKDGYVDLLYAGGITYGLGWLKSDGSSFSPNATNSNSSGRLNATNAETSISTFAGVWAAQLKAKTAENTNEYADLVLTRLNAPRVEISFYYDKNNKVPFFNTYSGWNCIYDGTSQCSLGDTWMPAPNFYFPHVIAADVDNCGQKEIIVTTSAASQFWIFKKDTTRYLTMRNVIKR